MTTGELTTADKGRAVIYTPKHGEQESGVITSWNDRFVFVRYGDELQSKATDPGDLQFDFDF